MGIWTDALVSFGLYGADVPHRGVAAYPLARRSTCRLFPDALPALAALQGHVRMAILTSGIGELQREKWRQTGIDSGSAQ